MVQYEQTARIQRMEKIIETLEKAVAEQHTMIDEMAAAIVDLQSPPKTAGKPAIGANGRNKRR